MKTKKNQQIFFSSLAILSILSSLYLNLHIEPKHSLMTELTDNESSLRLMADIDAFQHIIQNVVKEVLF
jgi:hypothetical protein